MTSSHRRPVGLLALPIGLSLAAASCERVTAVQSYPAYADLKDVSEPKPRPPLEIATDPQANTRHDAELEGWGERVQAAGVRICTWAESMGAKLPFDCRR